MTLQIALKSDGGELIENKVEGGGGLNHFVAPWAPTQI